MHILYVEDSLEEQYPITKALRSQNHDVTIIDNVFEVLNYLKGHEPEILLCDYLLGSGPNGLFVAENVRNLYPNCTIVMISCHLNVDNAVEAMHIGADDFVQRPIRIPELLERLWKAVTRHQKHTTALGITRTTNSPLMLNNERRTATWQNHPLDLTPTEYILLAQLASKPGQMLAFSDLWASSRGDRLSSDQAREMLKPHISKLRAKLVMSGASKDVILNVRGQGYLWSLE